MTGAADYAFYKGRPLNRFITIKLNSVPFRHRPQHYVSGFLKRAADWLADQGVPPCYIWVLENPPHDGLHFHVLIHVPPVVAPRFAQLQRSWLKAAGIPFRQGVSHTKLLTSPEDNSSALSDYLREITNFALYLCKGARPEICDLINSREFKLPHRFQGEITGKRCGTSEAVGQKARSKFKYLEFIDFLGRRHRWGLRPLVLAHADRRFTRS